MTIRLYVVHNSHPCVAVAKALELKGLEYKVVEWPPPMHAAMQMAIFGSRTVPGITIDGEKVQGSRKIFHRLDELVPEPRLYPVAHRSEIESADRWGATCCGPVWLTTRSCWPPTARAHTSRCRPR
jgi:glutathione S-transferase